VDHIIPNKTNKQIPNVHKINRVYAVSAAVTPLPLTLGVSSSSAQTLLAMPHLVGPEGFRGKEGGGSGPRGRD
jgi:hypothetical protein